jgi:hypothetical protein
MLASESQRVRSTAYSDVTPSATLPPIDCGPSHVY